MTTPRDYAWNERKVILAAMARETAQRLPRNDIETLNTLEQILNIFAHSKDTTIASDWKAAHDRLKGIPSQVQYALLFEAIERTILILNNQ